MNTHEHRYLEDHPLDIGTLSNTIIHETMKAGEPVSSLRRLQQMVYITDVILSHRQRRPCLLDPFLAMKNGPESSILNSMYINHDDNEPTIGYLCSEGQDSIVAYGNHIVSTAIRLAQTCIRGLDDDAVKRILTSKDSAWNKSGHDECYGIIDYGCIMDDRAVLNLIGM